MQRFIRKSLFLLLWGPGLALGQNVWLAGSIPPGPSGSPIPTTLVAPNDSPRELVTDRGPAVVVSPELPQMGPDLALQVYRNRAERQAEQLSAYSATTVIRAELPDTKQTGEYELQRQYSAPRRLAFKVVRFDGDNFVKNNVLLRLMQSEVNHVEKDDPTANAINPVNYKFSYKGITQINGRSVHIYHVKPRRNQAGLFKGKVFLDTYSGSIVRAEGKPVKSPSIFIKKVDFVQDYADVDSFTFPVHLHSEAQARIVGKAIVDVYDSDYHPISSNVQAQAGSL